MQTTARNNLFRIDFSFLERFADKEMQFSFVGLYHHLVVNLIDGCHRSEALTRLANKLISVAEQAYTLRQFDAVGFVAEALLRMPLSRGYEGIGLFYQALNISRQGFGDSERARPLFELAAQAATPHYRAKAMLALGRSSLLTERGIALGLYRDTMKLLGQEPTFDPVTTAFATRLTAVARALDGDHRGALIHLDKCLPLARVAGFLQPVTYYDYLNSLAVELGEVGRVEEARRVSQIAVATPYAKVYPEWRETLDEIESKTRCASRSVVAVSQAPTERTDFPAPQLSQPDESASLVSSTMPRPKNSAHVINLHDWKNKLAMKAYGHSQNKLTPEEIELMTLTEKQAAIARYIYGEEVSEEALDSILAITGATDQSAKDKI